MAKTNYTLGKENDPVENLAMGWNPNLVKENPIEALRQIGVPADSYETEIIDDRTGTQITPSRVRVHSLSEINPFI